MGEGERAGRSTGWRLERPSGARVCPVCALCVSRGCPVCVQGPRFSPQPHFKRLYFLSSFFSQRFTLYFIQITQKFRELKKYWKAEMQLLSFPPSCLFYLLLFLSTRGAPPLPLGSAGADF